MRCSPQGRRRAGISDIVATVLTIAVTIIAGAAVWGYVRSQAGSSEYMIANSVIADSNFLAEHFNVEDIYFGTTTTASFWVYNTGSVPFQAFSVRMFDSGGNFNLLYNYTQSGSSKTDYVYDLKSTVSGRCKTTASSYESPTLSGTVVKVTNAQLYTLTIPPTQSNCPSFGQTFGTGDTYSVVVTGLYGNAVTYSISQ